MSLFRHWFALVCLALAVAAAGCGGSPSSPSASDSLAGTWRGSMTLSPDGQAPSTFAAEWTLRETAQTTGQLYDATMRATGSSWFAASWTGTAIIDPGTTPTAVHTNGLYASPRGCQGSYYSIVTHQANRLTGSFYGVDCGPVQFTGTVTLTR